MKTLFLDSSIVIPFVSGIRGTKEDRKNPANRKALQFIRETKAPVRISIVTFAETYRDFGCDPDVAQLLIDTFGAPLHLTMNIARRWARMQNRSDRTMGDNDAWIAAHAIVEGGEVVGHDEKAFKGRPDLTYIDFIKS
ncbi:type II toxin-antitoxin system VapC family toxin [Geminisphaera colitermitum]|uniref:type II toxin-antitoxin system VapC family toxin n=1 Tax=Geminisphaera colitermitum TaxID=1148786 RepID=UPI0005BCF1F2|nr:type II toxin-antitoxin system VapC family toxin [Geminisphaera colitermitum]